MTAKKKEKIWKSMVYVTPWVDQLNSLSKLTETIKMVRYGNDRKYFKSFFLFISR